MTKKSPHPDPCVAAAHQVDEGQAWTPEVRQQMLDANDRVTKALKAGASSDPAVWTRIQAARKARERGWD